MNIATVTKTVFFWACILVLSALLQNLLPLSRIPAWERLGLYVAAVYLMFRGGCLVIHNWCCWILIKTGYAEEEKKS
jgi:hypothetical protein